MNLTMKHVNDCENVFINLYPNYNKYDQVWILKSFKGREEQNTILVYCFIVMIFYCSHNKHMEQYKTAHDKTEFQTIYYKSDNRDR